jgi:RNA-binding protein Tab2/Atab2
MAADRLPPKPLPEALWGDTWRFASVMAGDLPDLYEGRMIPFLQVPTDRLPLNSGLASSLAIPGVVIVAGRKSRQLGQWLQAVSPVSLHAIAGEPDGLILFAGMLDRWILTTSEDPEVKSAGIVFEQRKQVAGGLHFLLIKPDDSGMTDTGFWLLG